MTNAAYPARALGIRGSAQQRAAVDDYLAAGHVGRHIRGEEQDDLPISSGSPIRLIGRVARKVSSTAGLADWVSAFTGTLATRIVQLRPRDPESGGIAGRRNGFFETSFMPGRMFTSPADFNAQFTSGSISARTAG